MTCYYVAWRPLTAFDLAGGVMGYVEPVVLGPYEVVYEWRVTADGRDRFLWGWMPALGVNVTGGDEDALEAQAWLAVDARGGDRRRGMTMREAPLG